MTEENTLEFIGRMPKVELHLHLEGTIQPTTAIELMHRHQAVNAPQTVTELLNLYNFQDLTHFVQAMKIVSNHITTLEDLHRICGEMLVELVRQNVKYIEFDCALQKYVDLGWPLLDVITVLEKAVQEAQACYGIMAGLVVNLQRSHGAEKTAHLVEAVCKLAHPFIRGIGLSGDETKYPQREFTRAFAIAREAGLHRTVHAGEAMGSQSVWDALSLLHAERIDHGTRSIEDPKLVRHLIEKQIPLTQCLTSNKRLNIVAEVSQHPFQLFFRSGVLVTLNTDDPQIFQSSLTDEYQLAFQTFSLSHDELRRIVLNGVRACFLSPVGKEQLLLEFSKVEKNE